jgi:tetratricopeptide (TPR) repeat protein
MCIPRTLLFFLAFFCATCGAFSALAQQKSEERYADVLELVEEKAFQKALERLKNKEDTDPNSADHLAIKSFLIARLGEGQVTKEAKREQFLQGKVLAERAIELDPDHAFAHFAKAISLGLLIEDASPTQKLEHADAIKKAADKALEEDPTLAGPHHILGRWHQNLAQLSSLGRWSIGFFYDSFSEASFEKAIHHFQEAADLKPEESIHYYQMAVTYRKMGENGKAREKAKKALELARAKAHDEVREKAEEFLKGE